ncbi:RimJ/RimL family protein N-acetyltransferase [Actinomadura coerulea]|uniref:RimJ/RimL family protein N-acetyltransferase n=1 Tax=Actinomadura coerulea TaxID=46159 RepID=A0A7X0G2R9_9ACTN|nr:GNAT family N-acetyltransferase [Actinomadura coerulea]MBB6398337.1 RimJ/RimL family protein N-acetyltransferase [Actinomadura coerulea]GGQ10448.1 acetyltransferase [Actinomadura coerulea]
MPSSDLTTSGLPDAQAPDADLTTDRLVLRPWTTGEIAAVQSGDRLAHWADDFPAEGDRVIAGFIAENPSALGEYGQRLIIERSTGLVVGAVGLFWPPADGAVEFGYGVVPSRRGRAYATEAARAIAAFALTAPGVDKAVATVELSNPASVRVLEKAGLRLVGTSEGLATYSTA